MVSTSQVGLVTVVPTGVRRRRLGQAIVPYLFILPFILFFLALFVGPAANALFVSFTRFRGFGSATWVGLNNYKVMLSYNVFWIELGNTFFYWLAHAVPMMALAFLLAVLVNSKLIRYRQFFKPIIFMPQMVASVAAALLFQNFFGTQYGILNSVLGVQIPWLTDPDLSRWTVVVVLIWRGTGYWFVIFLAGLTTVNPEIMDAARVDGANAWQRLTRVTIPLMRPTFLFAFVVDAIVTLRLFTEPNVLGGRAGTLAPVEMAPVLNLVVENIRGGQFGLAAATGWLLFIIVAAMTFLLFRLIDERNR